MEYLAEKNTEDTFIYGYRIVAPRWAHDALSGEGARKFGGRWNSAGKPMVYLGGSRALAALEMLVHLTTPSSRQKTYNIIEVGIPKELVTLYPASALPKDWQNSPAPMSTQEIGDDWLSATGQLALSIPSVLIPEENNILLNPLHPDFQKITSSAPNHFTFDKRF
jgi:RES domain-containing protein